MIKSTCMHACDSIDYMQILDPFFFFRSYRDLRISYNYTIIVVCPSVRPLMAGGQQKRFDLNT